MEKQFEQISADALQEMSLESDYLMSLSLTAAEINERFGIKFVRIGDDRPAVWFAAIKDPASGLIFQFDARDINDRSGTVSVSARGKNLDAREAYSAFTSAVALGGRDVTWISDSI